MNDHLGRLCELLQARAFLWRKLGLRDLILDGATVVVKDVLTVAERGKSALFTWSYPRGARAASCAIR